MMKLLVAVKIQPSHFNGSVVGRAWIGKTLSIMQPVLILLLNILCGYFAKEPIGCRLLVYIKLQYGSRLRLTPKQI